MDHCKHNGQTGHKQVTIPRQSLPGCSLRALQGFQGVSVGRLAGAGGRCVMVSGAGGSSSSCGQSQPLEDTTLEGQSHFHAE